MPCVEKIYNYRISVQFHLSGKVGEFFTLESGNPVIYFVIFQLKVLTYTCINRSGNGAD